MGETLWNGIEMENPDSFFRLGTDSMVLADFIHPRKGAKICDLGTGTGAIALMLLASDPTARVTGIELQEDFAAAARQNAEKNCLADRFTVLTGDLRQIRTLLPANSFHMVVSNPPYFPADSLAPQDSALALARTELACTTDDLCAAAAWLLQSGGKFCLCHRPERLADVIFSLKTHHLEPKRLRFLRHDETAKRSLLLTEAVLDGKSGLSIEEDLLLYKNGEPTEDFCRIYHR